MPFNNLIQVHLHALVEHAVKTGVVSGYRQTFYVLAPSFISQKIIDTIAQHVMLELHDVIDFERSAWRTSALQGSPTGFGDPDV